MRRAIIRTVVLSSAAYAASSAAAQEATRCGQAAFASVVGASGGTLSAMNEQKRRSFMEKLQALKAQEDWSDADYAVRAKPYVQDEKISAYDARGKALLEKVQALGGGDSLTEEKRCAMLGELKGLLSEVVKNTREKWDYMFAKLSGALKPAAGAAAPKPPVAAVSGAAKAIAGAKPAKSGAPTTPAKTPVSTTATK